MEKYPLDLREFLSEINRICGNQVITTEEVVGMIDGALTADPRENKDELRNER
jgi:hypothetical protein